MSKGWIKLHRSLADWQWYDDHNATRLLIHLLIHVNYEDKKWKGVIIKAGSMVFSWDTLSQKSGLSVRQCRTAMKKLEDSKEATRTVSAKFQLVTLVKWDILQADDRQATGSKSGERQADDRQATTTKEIKNNKELKELRNSIASELELDKLEEFWNWMDYRDSIKKKVKNEKTLKALVKRLKKEPIQKIKWVVNFSIENNYQGLIWEKWKGDSSSSGFKGSNR